MPHPVPLGFSLIRSSKAANEADCVLLLPSGFLRSEPCQRRHHWVCQTLQKNSKTLLASGKGPECPAVVDVLMAVWTAGCRAITQCILGTRQAAA